MKTHPSAKILPKRTIMIVALAASSAVAMASCGSSSQTNQAMQSEAKMPQAGVPMSSPAAPEPRDTVSQAKGKAETPKSRTQLIKKAELTLVVKSIDESTRTVTKLVEKQQGDILGFQDEKPPDSSIRHIASMEIRVPEEKLDTTLNVLAKLGTVQSRSLTAEDVTDRLVDSEARLRNLRKSEEVVLKIMDRSGSIGDVLKASQELGNIRESIERIDAQLKSLRNQVAYSTINLNLEAAVSSAQTTEPSLGLRVQESWGKATHSVGEFTLSLLALSLWLLAYSPYFLLIVAAAYGLNRFRKQRTLPAAQDPQPPASN